MKSLAIVEEHLYRKTLSLTIAQIHKNPKIPKSATNNVLTRSLNECLSITTGLLSIIEVSGEKLLLYWGQSLRKSLILILHENPDSPEFPKSAFSIDLSRYPNSFLWVSM